MERSAGNQTKTTKTQRVEFGYADTDRRERIGDADPDEETALLVGMAEEAHPTNRHEPTRLADRAAGGNPNARSAGGRSVAVVSHRTAHLRRLRRRVRVSRRIAPKGIGVGPVGVEDPLTVVTQMEKSDRVDERREDEVHLRLGKGNRTR